MQGYLTALLGLDEFILKSSVVGSFFRLKDEYDHKLRVRGQNPSMHPLTQTGERTLHGTPMGHTIYPYGTQCTPMGDTMYSYWTQCTPMGHTMYPYGAHSVPLWDTMYSYGTQCTPMGHILYPNGTQIVPLWGTQCPLSAYL